MGRKITTKEFIERAKEVHGDRYDYSLVEYKGNKTPISIVCYIHGKFEQIPIHHLRGSGCPLCYKSKQRLATEKFIERAKEVHGNKYDYSLVKYINNKSKVKIICSEHGEFEQIPMNHLNGLVCPKCNPKKQKHTNETFIEKAKEIHGDRYDYSLVEYKGINEQIKIICPIHGEFKQKAVNHLQGSNCPQCAGNRRLTLKEFISRAREIHGDKYDYSLVEYKNIDTRIKIICPVHGEFEQIPYLHISKGNGCPVCNESHGEKEIRVFLQNKGIYFEREKTFEDLKYKRLLKYDFHLPEYNLLIEYDGQQHFDEDTLYWNEDIKVRDKIKDEYAEENGYYLIRIGYWEDVKKILSYFT